VKPVFVVRKLLAAGVALSAALTAAPVRAQTAAGTDPVLESLVQEAVARNPDLLAAAEEARAARARPAQARALPDPMLSLAYVNDAWRPTLGTREMTTLGLMASQDLPWPGKRALRGSIAERAAEQVAHRLERARLSVVASVRRAYFGLLQARALADLTREQADLWQQIEGVARARYGVGQGNQQDVLRTQVELTRVGQTLAEQELEIRVRMAEINRLLDRLVDSPLETPAVLEVIATAPELRAELDRARAVSPELAAARVDVERARLAMELAKKEYRPDFSVQAGYMNRGGLDPMWQAGVGINLPVNRSRRASAVAEAQALESASRARASAVELQLRLRTQERLAQLEATQKIATLYREGVVPQDRMSVEAAIASYQAGRLPFITVLEALATLYSDRATLVRLLAGQSRIRTSLDEASLESTSDLPAMAPAAMAGGSAASGTAGGMTGMKP
jgi:cobalt-zinc-cadmium efflux system outer membrane protein